jgi:outer membrane protein OmpA-like peptidoglycan-associated protein
MNPYVGRLYYARLNDGSLEEISPVIFSATEPSNNQSAAAISADGNFLYYSEWKKEKGNLISSIYYAIKLDSGWSLPILLPSVNLSGYNSKQPFCSADGKYLFFASDRPSGSGKFDIWCAPLNEDGTTGEPVNAGVMINSSGDEQAPFYHNSSSTMVFSSNGRPGMGGFDLYAAKGNVNAWGTPENLGHPVNSSRDDMYFFAEEKAGLLSNAVFSSDRGDGCCLEMYSITKAPKNKRLTGILRDCNENIPVAGAEVVLKDATGKSWSATTDAEGKYEFVLTSGTYQDLSLVIKKELYNEAVAEYKIENIDESDFLTDVLKNIDLCIAKVPMVEPVEEKPTIKAEDVVTIYFDFDRSDLKTGSTGLLDSIYNVLMEYPAATIQISGYTDGLGSIEYNNKLSDKRARACANYLIEKGVQTGRITFVSFGACCPVEMEIINGRDNSDGRSRNRRALINIKKD